MPSWINLEAEEGENINYLRKTLGLLARRLYETFPAAASVAAAERSSSAPLCSPNLLPWIKNVVGGWKQHVRAFPSLQEELLNAGEHT